MNTILEWVRHMEANAKEALAVETVSLRCDKMARP